MILEGIYKHIIEVLNQAPFFTDNYGLAIKKSGDDGIEQPVYRNNNKWNRIKFNKGGISYFRENGSTVMGSEESGMTSCDRLITFEKPIKVVALVKRDLFLDDAQYAQDNLAQMLVKEISLNGGSLRRQLKANRLDISPTSYETNSQTVLNNEFSNISRKDFQYYDVVVSVDFLISIAVKQDCIDDLCETP